MFAKTELKLVGLLVILEVVGIIWLGVHQAHRLGAHVRISGVIFLCVIAMIVTLVGWFIIRITWNSIRERYFRRY